jgi:crotonobetainyl-CoA:carnitine CoA-transferase CaiB-like acyl-CoA transferase
MGNAHPSVFPYEPFATADADLIVIAANDRQFRRLCEALDIPEVADDERFLHNGDRTKNREALRPLLEDQLTRRPASEWFEVLREAGVPSGPINTIDEGFATADRFGLDPVVEVGEGDRALPTTRHPIRFSATPVDYRRAPPELDEHGTELRAWLGSHEESG